MKKADTNLSSPSIKPDERRYSNRNEPKDAILRQWVMLQMIPREPDGITAQQLRHKLADADPLYAVHKRTIERNLIQMMSVFPSLDYLPATGGNLWYWQKDTVMDVPKLDAKTALMLRLAETFLTPMFPPSVLADLRPHFNQAEKALREIGEQGYKRWTDKIHILQNAIQLLKPNICPNVLDVVYTALFQDLRFNALYRVRSGERRDYEISPRGLVFRDGIVYAVCTLSDQPDLRQLPLHRMETAALTDIPVTPLQGFSLDRYVREYFDYPLRDLKINQQRRHEIPGTLKLEVALREISAVHLLESPLAQDQKHKTLSDGRIHISATVANTERLRWWLLSYGPHIEVLSPPDLRSEIRQTLLSASHVYGD